MNTAADQIYTQNKCARRRQRKLPPITTAYQASVKVLFIKNDDDE